MKISLKGIYYAIQQLSDIVRVIGYFHSVFSIKSTKNKIFIAKGMTKNEINLCTCKSISTETAISVNTNSLSLSLSLSHSLYV